MSQPPGQIGRPTDRALWESAVSTLRDVVLPGIDDARHRQVVIQLIGLAAYARDRGPDPSVGRVGELADGLDVLARAGNPNVAPRWPAGSARVPEDVMSAVADVLAACVDRTDVDAATVHATLRPVLVRHLTEDLVAEDVMLGAFRGRVPDG